MTDERDANEVLMGGGGHITAKFDKMRVWVGGTIIRKPTTRQETEFGTGKPRTYPKSGDPIMGILVDVQTDERVDDEDDGIRRMYIEGKRMKDATRDAVTNSGASGLETGGQLFLAWVSEEPPSFQGARGAKVYEGRYYPPTTPVPSATNGQAETMPDPRGQSAPMTDPRSGLNEFAPMSQAGPGPEFAQEQPQEAATAPMGDPRVGSSTPPPPTAQNGAQGSGADPTAEAIAALRAAGIPVEQVYPGWRG